MSGPKEYGVFLPIANGGWIVSKSTPVLDGGWAQNREAALIAEEVGFDFVMAMGKWRGFGGDTDHWGHSLEAVTMMAGIAAATKRVKVWATLHAILHNPAVAAKMIATLDHISGGRAGLNIVAGAYSGEFAQMGAWDTTLDHDARYGLTEEWTQIVKRLWTEPSVSFAGKHFTFKDCVSEPKPLGPPFLICAGMSERGFEFSVREADGCFIGGRNEAETSEVSRRARALAAKLGKPIRTYCMMTVICAATDQEAQAKAQKYREGLDEGAVRGMLESYGVAGNAMTARAQGAFMTQTVVGSPATCAAKIENFLRDCDIDGLMFIYDDYAAGLRVTGRENPAAASRGFCMKPEWIAPHRTALILIDFQVDFGAPDGAMARQGADIAAAQAALTNAMALTDAARGAKVEVVFVRLLTRSGIDNKILREARQRREENFPELCVEGSRGADFIGPQPRSGEAVISKTRFSAFAGTALADHLRAQGGDTLVLAGLTTECCVQSSAWDGLERDFHVFLAADACAAYEPELHRHALRALALNGVIVEQADIFVTLWNTK